MKKELMEVSACPTCRGDLELEMTEEKGRDIWTGSLACAACHKSCAISEGVSNLLPQN